MVKTVPESKFVELKGLDRISSMVHEMKCLWREINKDDVGIDGEIEILRPKSEGKGYEVTGGIIKVQASPLPILRFITVHLLPQHPGAFERHNPPSA